MTLRRAAMLASGALLVASAARAEAPPTKRCIAAAESGQQQRREGKLVEARASFVACTANDCPSVVRRDCARWIDELDTTIPSIVLKLEDEDGNEVTEARVQIDGETVVAAASGRAIPLDPGSHRLAWMRPAGDLEQEIVVREGERNRIVVLRPKAVETKPAAPPPSSAPARRSSVLPLFLGGVGLGLAGAGGILWGIGLSERSNLQSTCAAAHSCSDSDVSASKTKLVVGDVLVGVAIVAIGASVYLLLHPDDQSALAQRKPIP